MATGKSGSKPVCARCGKGIRDWMGSTQSALGPVTICDICAIQEQMELTGGGPKGKLQFPPKKYDGPEYWHN